jgi:hypothetical protein
VAVLVTFDTLPVNVILVKSEVRISPHAVKMTRVIFGGEASAARYTRFVFIPEPDKFVKHFLEVSAILGNAFNVFPHSLNFPFGFFSLSNAAPFD